MWNALVSALLLRSSVVLMEGDAERQWEVAAETQPTLMGVSPAYLMACRKAGMELPALPNLRVLATAGSPLPPEGYEYVYEQLGPDVLLINGSGGTDVCSAIVSGGPMHPGLRGRDRRPLPGRRHRRLRPRRQRGRRRARRARHQAADAVDAGARSGATRTASATGPRTSTSTPASGARATGCASPSEGTCVITGRSDATLNRGGVRMGTSELYSVVEELPEVSDSLVVHLEDDEGGAGELLLFVVADLDEDLRRADRGRVALAALAAPRAGHDRRRPGDPAHAHREEARGAGQADPARRPGRVGGQPRRARRAARHRRVRAVHQGEGEGMTVVQPALAPPRIVSDQAPDGSRILRSEMALEPYEASLGVLLRRWAEEAPDRVFLAERPGDGDWVELTWGEANRKATRDRPGAAGPRASGPTGRC